MKDERVESGFLLCFVRIEYNFPIFVFSRYGFDIKQALWSIYSN